MQPLSEIIYKHCFMQSQMKDSLIQLNVECIKDITHCMIVNFLRLKSDKPEVLILSETLSISEILLK